MEKNHINSKNVALFLLRIALGWIFLYSGISKALNPEWTAAGMLGGAKTFSGIYSWFASAENIGWVNFMNAWGQTFIGAGLIFGTFTRLASYFGILLMALYYFPGLDFPYVKNGFLIEDHVIFALVFAVLAVERAGTIWGLDTFINKKLKSWWI